MKHWKDGEKFTVHLEGNVYAGTVLKVAASTRGNYQECLCQLVCPNPLNPDQLLTTERVIQSYKLRQPT